ncbi:hypothetical protein Tco_1509789, partial [Tanacetum coccineum]
EELIRASRLKKVMGDKGKKSNHAKLRIVVFLISLAGGARRWFDRTKESITCWVDLTAIFLENTTCLLTSREITLP